MLPNAMEKRLVLNSWKEIADYMGRGVRTVQRYERDLRLPVHRPAGKSRSAVLAFADEIDHWMRRGSLRFSVNGKAVKHLTTNHSEWQHLLTNSEMLLKRTDALKTQISELTRTMQETERRRKRMLDRILQDQISETWLANKSKQSKSTEFPQLIVGPQKNPAQSPSFPATHKPTNGHSAAVEKH